MQRDGESEMTTSEQARADALAGKPCQSCSAVVPVGILYCAKCAHENLVQWFKSHPWLKAR